MGQRLTWVCLLCYSEGSLRTKLATSVLQPLLTLVSIRIEFQGHHDLVENSPYTGTRRCQKQIGIEGAGLSHRVPHDLGYLHLAGGLRTDQTHGSTSVMRRWSPPDSLCGT